MMIYEFECKEHGRFDTPLSPSNDDLSVHDCPDCSRVATRIYGAGYAGHTMTFTYGWDPTSGRYFDSKAQMVEDAAERGQTLHRA